MTLRSVQARAARRVCLAMGDMSEDKIIIGKEREDVTCPIPVVSENSCLQFKPRAVEDTASD